MRMIACAAVLSAMACSPGRPAPADGLAPCLVPGIDRPARCGVVEVPEERASGGSALRLRVVKVPARLGRADDALFLLAGGPGQAASEVFPQLWPALGALGDDRDVVMVDQRGTGQSAALACPHEDDLAESFAPGSLVRAAERCLPRLRDRRLSAYGTAASADDLDDVRAALGYARVDLLGISYGTRLAMAYAARHPDRVRALVLDAVAPPSLVLGAHFGRDAERALGGLFAACRADAACNGAFPGAQQAFFELLARLAEKPAEVRARNPKTGAALSFSLSRAGLLALGRGALYAPELASLLPYALAQAEAGRYQPLVAQAAALSDSLEQSVSLGLLLTIACAEDAPRITAADLADEKQSLFGAALADELREACLKWPVSSRPARSAGVAQAPAPSGAIAAPALLLSGGLDPVTPPAWAEAAPLSRRKLLVAREAAHGIAIQGCAPRLIARFLDRPDPNAVDGACLSRYRRPPFFIDGAGPAP